MIDLHIKLDEIDKFTISSDLFDLNLIKKILEECF